MELPLLSPASNTFLKNWPAYNEFNCDQIDDYAGPCLPSHGLQTYTPQLTASTTNPTLGTGSNIVGYYYKLFDDIWTWGQFRFGTSGASGGSGTYSITLPFTATNFLGFSPEPIVGHGFFFDFSAPASSYAVLSVLSTASTLSFLVKADSGGSSRFVTNNSPAAVSTQDGISWFAKYQRLSS